MLYEALSCLHKRGYEKLRVMSFYSPSGCFFRSVISVKENFDKTGFVCEEDERYPMFKHTTGAGFDYFDEGSFENKSVEELADKILEKYPEFKELGRGEDKEYLIWYSKVLDLVRKGHYPYAFEDYGYDIYYVGKIELTNGDYIEYAPPGSYMHK